MHTTPLPPTHAPGRTLRRSLWRTALCAATSAALAACGGAATSGLGACGPAASTPMLSGTVTGVHDGDTLTLQTANATEQVRLQGIDAPELAQAFGPDARHSLQQLVGQQAVRVAVDGRDRYGRILGQVWGGPNCLDVNQQLLAAGMAWFYTAYACDLPPARRDSYQNAHTQARAQRQGLWAHPQPVAPWVYRNGLDPAAPVCGD